MAVRVTFDEVQQVINTGNVPEDKIRTHIEVASHLIDDLLGSSGLSATRLKDIELYLAAHFTAIYSPGDGQVVELRMGETEERYAVGESMLGKGLEQTSYGQQALALDTTGTLASLGRRQSSMRVFGHIPPS